MISLCQWRALGAAAYLFVAFLPSFVAFLPSQAWADITCYPYLTKLTYDRIYGTDSAPVTVIEYISLDCPHCAEFLSRDNDVLLAYWNKGLIRMIFRQYPRTEVATSAAILALYSEDYLSAAETLFDDTEPWASDDNLVYLRRLARRNGFSDAQFDSIETSDSIRSELDAEHACAERLLQNAGATPVILIFNGGSGYGWRYDGVPSPYQLDQTIASYLRGHR